MSELEKDKKIEEKREEKNTVFNMQQTVNADGIPILSKREAARQDFRIDIPIDQVPLPSGGKVYPLDHPLHLMESLEYKAMTAREEDILMSPALIKKGTVITELIRSCLINPNIDVTSLLSGDRNALMIAIRSSGYGRMYETTYTCPGCDFKNEFVVDLNELPIKPLSIDPTTLGSNEFEFNMPLTKKRVLFKFLTGKEEEEILSTVEMRKKKGLLNSSVITTRLMHSILEIDGNKDRSFINKFIQVMPARDSLALRNFIDKHEPGVEMKVDFRCKSCDHFEEIQLPIGSEFFWPKN